MADGPGEPFQSWEELNKVLMTEWAWTTTRTCACCNEHVTPSPYLPGNTEHYIFKYADMKDENSRHNRKKPNDCHYCGVIYCAECSRRHTINGPLPHGSVRKIICIPCSYIICGTDRPKPNSSQ